MDRGFAVCLLVATILVLLTIGLCILLGFTGVGMFNNICEITTEADELK